MQPEPIFEEQTEDRDKAIAILENNLKRSLDFRKKVNDYKSQSFFLLQVYHPEPQQTLLRFFHKSSFCLSTDLSVHETFLFLYCSVFVSEASYGYRF